MKLEILSSGITLIQDAGRKGYELVGVAKSGAWDNTGYQLATGLIEQKGQPSFEILLGKLEIKSPTKVLFAVVGEALLKVAGKDSSPGSAMMLESETVLSIEPKGYGPVYLAVAGLEVHKTLGSAATDTMSGLGPKLVQAGDLFDLTSQTNLDSLVGSFIQPRPKLGNTFHFIKGPHQIDISGTYEISAASRTGIRLSTINYSGSAQLESFPVLPGSIQITPSGEPVILGPDAGTTGGYQVAGTIIEAEIDYLAQLRSGSRISLQEVSVQEAKAKSESLKHYLTQAVIRPSSMGSF